MADELDYKRVLQPLREIHGGSLSRERLDAIEAAATSELQRVITHRAEPEYEEYIAYLLDILEYSNDREDVVPLFELLLEGPRGFLAEQALGFLCNSWDLTDRYIPYLVKFMRGVEWDELDGLQHKATWIAGYYLRLHKSPELLRELIRIVENTSGNIGRSQFPFLADESREIAYEAICEALGKPVKEPRHFSTREIDPSIMQEAKERLLRKEPGD